MYTTHGEQVTAYYLDFKNADAYATICIISSYSHWTSVQALC